MLIFASITLWVSLGSLAFWAKARPRGASVLLGTGVIAVAQIVGIVTVLGWLGRLQRGSVLGMGLLVNTVLINWAWRDLRNIIRQLSLDVHEAWGELRQSVVAVGALALMFGVWALIAGIGLILPPTDWDGLAEHVPVAFFHLQNNSLARIDTPYRGINAYPANGSILIEWALLGMGDDSLVDLSQWPLWLLGTLAVYSIARRMGADRVSAVLGSLVFSVAPVVILQARSAYVDLTLAGLALAALALLADYQLTLRSVGFGVGCALGVIIGLKYAGALEAALIALLMLVRITVERQRSPQILAESLIAMTLPMLMLGAHWYLRNWHDLGNPVWPIAIQIGNHAVFDGVWTTESFYKNALPSQLVDWPYWMQLWTVWREPTSAYAPDMRLGGLGPLWLAVGLPCLAVFGIQAVLTRHLQRLALVGFALGAFFLTPANWHTRYILAPMAISSVAVALVLRQLTRWPRATLSWLTIALSVYGFFLALLRGPVTPADMARFEVLPPIERRAVFADDVPSIDPAMRWFDRNIPNDAVVAYSWGGVILYPFWAQTPARQMIYVAPTEAPAWFNNLRQRHVTHLVVRQGSDEARAAVQDTRFQAVYVDEMYAVYTLP